MPFSAKKTPERARKIADGKENAAGMRIAGVYRKRRRIHSTGKNMDCVAALVLRLKTRPGMPCFE